MTDARAYLDTARRVVAIEAAGLAAQLGVDEREAEQLLERYFREFPKIRGYLDQAARQALWSPVSRAPEKLVSDGGSNQTFTSTSAAFSAASMPKVASRGQAIR